MKTPNCLLTAFSICFLMIGCNSSNDREDRQEVICISNIGVNLPSSAASLTLSDFDPENALTFTQSTTYTAFDIYAESYLHTVYFIKTASDTWQVIFYHDGSAIQIKSPTSGEFLISAEIGFDVQGTLDYIFPESIASEKLVLRDDDFEHYFEFRFPINFTTQLDAGFSINLLESSGCVIKK